MDLICDYNPKIVITDLGTAPTTGTGRVNRQMRVRSAMTDIITTAALGSVPPNRMRKSLKRAGFIRSIRDKREYPPIQPAGRQQGLEEYLGAGKAIGETQSIQPTAQNINELGALEREAMAMALGRDLPR